MSDPFTGEPDPFDVTVTPAVPEFRSDSWIVSAILENGTGADGGEVELRITDTAKRAYGLGRCVREFERWVNSTVRPEYRLDAALALGAQGPFTVVAVAGGPSVALPRERSVGDLAA